MPNPGLPKAVLEATLRAVEQTKTKKCPKGSEYAAARALGISRSTLRARLDALHRGASAEERRARRGGMPRDALLKELAALIRENPGLTEKQYRGQTKSGESYGYNRVFGGWNAFKRAALKAAGIEKTTSANGNIRQDDDLVRLRIAKALRKGGGSLDELARAAQVSRGHALDIIDGMRSSGSIIDDMGGRFEFGRSMAPAFTQGPVFEYVSRKDNTFVFGALGDSHLGSKYERLDVTRNLYDIYAREGVDRVFHTGNWIDGDEPKNRHDIAVHGIEPQLKYLAKHYPIRKGITTYAVTGEDHEGWWTRSEGIDVGGRAEDTMRKHKREDWVNLGFIEAHVKLVNANSGKVSILSVVHPGGGTAYALSYSVQKIVEALEGGEKPAVALYGHYHKLWAGNIRNVWVVCTGCGQDQTVFTRNKIKQEVHVGGTLVKLEQDPRTGAIISMMPRLIRYFVKGFYNNRWNRADTVVLPERRAA